LQLDNSHRLPANYIGRPNYTDLTITQFLRRKSYWTCTVYHSDGGYETLLDPETLKRARSLHAIQTLSDDASDLDLYGHTFSATDYPILSDFPF